MALVRGRSLDERMDEEIRFHLQMESDRNAQHGLTPDAARKQARLAFGGVQRFREEGRDARGLRPLYELGGDIRYAARILRRTPVFTIVAVTTLALGIGANSAIFSIINTVVLRPLPFGDEQSLVSVWDGGHSRAEFVAVRDRVRSLASAAAYFPNWDVTLGGEGVPERVMSALVTSTFASTLGVKPQQGRFFEQGEDLPGTEPVVVLSDQLWRRRFGADPALVGRSIDVDGVRRRVVGIAPPSLRFPNAETRLWMPLEINVAQPGPHWGAYGHYIVGRLAPGATAPQVRDEVASIARRLIEENPVWKPGPNFAEGILVVPLRERLTRDSRGLLYILFGAVGLVLLTACANVANLLIVRGAARERELAIRSTLGAGARRLARQLLTESLVLAGVGGVLGIAVAAATTRLMVQLLPATTPRLGDVRLDASVLAFTALLTIVTGLVFGVLPARRLSRLSPGTLMAGTRASAGQRQRRLASALVSAQIATAVVLVVGATLLVRSLDRLLKVDPGFEMVQVATSRVSPPRGAYPTPEAHRAFTTQLLERLTAAPGINGVAFTTSLPFEQRNEVMAMWIDGWTTDPNRLDLFELRRVTPDFFRVMGIPVRRGRAFGDTDNAGAAPVAVISESAARRFWPQRDAIDGRLRRPWPGWMTVVGVVADVRNNDLRLPPRPTLYIPFAQDPRPFFNVVMRSSGAPANAFAAVRTAVESIASDVAVSDEEHLDRMVERSVAAPRSMGVMLMSFGVLALILGAIGTYGLVAYGVESRRQEFAVRIAVGAPQGSVVRQVVGEGLRLAAVGIAIGLAAAFALSGLLRALLYEVTPRDPIAFMLAPIVLGAMALLACAIPAWRATRVDPNAALRGGA